MQHSIEKLKCTYKLLNKNSGRDLLIKNGTLSHFLYQHLGDYRDSLEDIQRAINYVFDNTGGNIVIQMIKQKITGVVVINETGMQGYIPENILVYIAIDSNYRGKGLGKKLLKSAIKICKGDIALHVEKENPARFLYEKVGFTSPYLEMRFKRKYTKTKF